MNPLFGSDPTGHDDGSALTDEAFGEIGGVATEDVAGYEAVDSYVHHQFERIVAYANAGFAVGDFAANSLGLDVQAMTAPIGAIAGEAISAAGEMFMDGVNSMLAAYSDFSSSATAAIAEAASEVGELGSEATEAIEQAAMEFKSGGGGARGIAGRQRMIDVVKDQLGDVDWSAPTEYMPGDVVGSSGKPWMGKADGTTNTIYLSKYAMRSTREIADTLVHEELHFRLAARQGIPLGKQGYYEDWIAARATRIIERMGF